MSQKIESVARLWIYVLLLPVCHVGHSSSCPQNLGTYQTESFTMFATFHCKVKRTINRTMNPMKEITKLISNLLRGNHSR